MKRIFVSGLLWLITTTACSQVKQTMHYDGLTEVGRGNLVKNAKVSIRLSILQNNAKGPAIYTEIHKTVTDSAGEYHIEIGSGRVISGQFDPVVWSDGTFYLKTETDPGGDSAYSIIRTTLIRIPTDLSNDNIQGVDSASTYPGWGTIKFNNTRNRRPKKITVDLSTSYINLSYPADTYPIYRHFEWCDEDRNGLGNAFTLSYSENTNHAFFENTVKLGEVKLYPTAFQDLLISSRNSEIVISITKPVSVTNHSQTYAIKGPWKFIYFIEW